MRADRAKLADIVRRAKAGEDMVALTRELYAEPPSIRARSSSNTAVAPVQPALRRPLPCKHLGAVVEWCNSCGGGMRHVHDCDLHERCTRGRVSSNVRSCEDCGDYQPQIPNFSTRHLLMHIWPVRGNGVWQANVDQLKARLGLFNGQRVIAVAVDNRTDCLQAVQSHFGNHRIDQWIEVPNNSQLREVLTWPLLWERIRPSADSAVFYCHAKGVSRPVNRGVTIHRWVQMLWSGNLDYWPTVEGVLCSHPIAGCFKKVGNGFNGSRSSWHYSGTFYWVRSSDLHQRWQHIDRQWWGTEAWPGLHWRPEEAGVLFGDGYVPSLDLYSMSVLERMEVEFEQWKSQQRLSPIVTG